ncbi:MAG TPA: GNAT family N-acetyltransferase [Dehalococcoidia bacterium]|jgi:ribosomal protein S18 acetylase RimI-like enzyme|nr:GNAT family N-acetyltransferase [Dehalococcoidia bacterium]
MSVDTGHLAMDRAALLARCHENYVEVFRQLARLGTGVVSDLGSTVFTVTRVPEVSLNPAFFVRVPPDAEDAISAMRAFYLEQGPPWLVRLLPGVAAAMTPCLRTAGFRELGAQPGMLLDTLDSGAPAPPAGLEVRIVRDMPALLTYGDVLVEAFELTREMLRPIETPRLLDAPDMTLYLGYVDSRPVATALRVSSHRIAGVFNIGTVPAYRGRGIGEAMTWIAALGGRDEGCVAAYLQASEMGFPVYRRMGFLHVADYSTWLPPA